MLLLYTYMLRVQETHRNGLNIIYGQGKSGGWHGSSSQSLAGRGWKRVMCRALSTSYLLIIGRIETEKSCRYIISWTHIENSPTLKCSLLLLSKFIKKCRHINGIQVNYTRCSVHIAKIYCGNVPAHNIISTEDFWSFDFEIKSGAHRHCYSFYIPVQFMMYV